MSKLQMLAVEDNIRIVQQLSDTDGKLQSPIDISLGIVEPLKLPGLTWKNYALVPRKMKVTNTGHTIILSAKWLQERPYLAYGPLEGSYVFSQLHFHWGTSNNGSEHTVDGEGFPLEMHVVHFKSIYLTQESALREKDGMVIIVYFFKLQEEPNPYIQILIDAINFVRSPHSSCRIEPFSIPYLFHQFSSDYYVYWGSLLTDLCEHTILWFVCRETIGICSQQMEQFRTVYDANNKVIVRNARDVVPLGDRTVFHVNPSSNRKTTLLPSETEKVPT